MIALLDTPPTTPCDCPSCARNRRFTEIIGMLPPSDARWMEGFLDSVIDMETEFDMLEASLDEPPPTDDHPLPSAPPPR